MICGKCGHCCKTYPIDVVHSDIVRWKEEKRVDILREVSFINNYPKKGYGGFYIEKSAKQPKQPCPFMGDNLCSIYETRPLVCHDFPESHDKRCSCPEYDYEQTSRLKRHLIRANQKRDLKKANDNFEGMMKILVEARR